MQCDDVQALLCAVPSPEETALLLRGPDGTEDGELFARALMFKEAKKQLEVIDTVMSFPYAAACVVQSCQHIRRFFFFFFFDVLCAFASSSPRVLLQRVRHRHEIFRTVGRTEVLAQYAQFAQRTGWTMQGLCNAFACLCQRCRNEAERLEASS